MRKKSLIKGLKTNYTKTGSGSPIILLHGWGCDLTIFSQLQQELEKTNEVYTIDLPGFGMSEVPNNVWGVSDYANFLGEFIKNEDIQNPMLFGHSFGGKISIQYASQNKIEKLILTGSSGIKPHHKFKRKLKIYLLKKIKKITTLFLSKKKSSEIIEKYRKKVGSIDYRNADGMLRKILVKSVNEDLKEVMPLIKTQTLILWGKDDHETPLSAGETMSHLIPNSELTALSNAGHYAFLDQKENFINHLKSFIYKK
jgi:pimeloyl-ACP methyl ester carboxylesterase